jgi:radical SAM protein with 4Fe4S-binding SPASM domain
MEPLPYRPHYCVWELTLACNLRCSHCGSSAGCARPDELNTSECLDVVEQLADLECRLITLSGGEPTLRPDWELIATAASRRGVTVNMVTNGTTITPELARRIAGSALTNVGISIDGPEDVNDQIRGYGTFRRSALGLARLAATGVRTAVLTHLDRGTAGCLEQMHDVAVDLGAVAWRVQLAKPMGRLDEHRERLLRPPDLIDVLARLARIKESSPIWVDVGDSIGYFGPHERKLRKTSWGDMQDVWSGCQAGRYAIGIESDGAIKGCLSLQAPLKNCEGRDPFREGDIRQRRLADLWFDPKAFAFNRHQTLDDLTGACRTCKQAKLCRGGAKCVAAAFTGALGEDPYCYWRVSQLASRRKRLARDVRRQAATALFGLGVGVSLGGCFSAVGEPEQIPTGALAPDAESTVAPPKTTLVDAGPDCTPPCPNCDYGVLPPECYQKVAGPDASTAFPCVCPDYGTLPGPGGDCCNPVVQDAGIPPDAADPCANVCCMCDYGVVPEGCCK